MKRVIDQAIVLRRVNYGDSDRVLTLLTKDHGKISVFAKAARKQKSRLSGGIELLSVSEIGYIDGKSDLKTLTSANLQKHFDGIVKEVRKTQLAFEALKKIEKMLDENNGQEYFGLLETYLGTLSNEAYDAEIVEIWFELQLLNVSGVLASIDVRETSDSISSYLFNYDEQFFSCHEEGAFSKNDIKLLRILSKSKAPIRLVDQDGDRANLLQITRNLFTMNLA